ncbi:MAG: hydantoinase/oxoprolinase family protein [Actinomycetia bacterium]|nr:hydantoinase/oxoprolinase family protein [Actinomycetes bacterium]
MALMLGIDTGGTFTDAVVVEHGSGRVVATAKASTTHHELAIGIKGALKAVLSEPEVEPEAIALVSLSTTLATNALVEGHGDPACLVMIGFTPAEVARLGQSQTTSGVGEGAGAMVGEANELITIEGGHDALGQELAPVDVATLERSLIEVSPLVSAYAVASQFSVRNPAHELVVAEVIRARTAMPVTASHELSARLDGPRRATTALLNARLIAMIGRLELAVRSSVTAAGIDAPFMMVRGDGSLAAAAFAAKRPIETILSGPAASTIGVRHLAGHDGVGEEAIDGLVVDIGGTTTDLAVMEGGRLKLATDGAVVAGHRTMVEAVALTTRGLGGDSEVHSGRPLLLGPGRAIPLSRLAIEYPVVVDLLVEQVAAKARKGQGRFLVLLTPTRSNVGVGPSLVSNGLDERQRQVMAALADGPRPEHDVVSSARVGRVVDRLRAQGLIRVSTFTPTDAALLLGRLEPSVFISENVADEATRTARAQEAARLGAVLMARSRTTDGLPLAASGQELAAMVEQALIDGSVEVVLETALAADGLLDPAGLVRSPLVRAALAGHRGLTTPSISLTDPLVAVGASANLYYPAVAAILGTGFLVPSHAGVANAVGAAVARIEIRRQLTISHPRAGQYCLHHQDQPVFASVDKARVHGEKVLTTHVQALAVEAGAISPEVTLRWTAKMAPIGNRIDLVEGTIEATASGHPLLTEPSSRTEVVDDAG